MSSLPKELKRIQLFTLAVGAVIGVSWVILVGGWISSVGALGACLAFLGGGLATALIGHCYADLAERYPGTGAEMVYGYSCFGDRWAFAAGWTLLLLYTAVAAFEAVSVTWVLDTLVGLPKQTPYYTFAGHGVDASTLILGISGIVAFVLLAAFGTRLVARVQDWLTWSKLAGLLAVVAIGICFGTMANLRDAPGAPAVPSAATRFALVPIATLAALVPLFLGGFPAAIQGTGELARGTRGIRALLMVIIGSCTALYCAVILATASLVPISVLEQQNLPAADAVGAATHSASARTFVLAVGLLGLLTTWNAVIFAASRVVFTLGRAGYIPQHLAAINERRGTPVRAVLLVGAMSSLGVFLGRGALGIAVNVAALAVVLMFVLVAAAALKVRWRGGSRWPHLLTPLFALLASVVLLLIGVVTTLSPSRGVLPPEAWVVAAWCAAGALLWRASAARRVDVSSEMRRAVFSNE